VALVPRPLILFDGVCHLCNWFVRFVLIRDSEVRFDFAPLQSVLAQAKLAGKSSNSVVLFEGEHRYEAHDAVLRILSSLRIPWPWIGKIFELLPDRILAWGYRMIANNRYQWVGRDDVCALSRPEWKNRFLQ
jgi:predicted DCC family thiol-disulfide oxidoreductase YuxK